MSGSFRHYTRSASHKCRVHFDTTPEVLHTSVGLNPTLHPKNFTQTSDWIRHYTRRTLYKFRAESDITPEVLHTNVGFISTLHPKCFTQVSGWIRHYTRSTLHKCRAESNITPEVLYTSIWLELDGRGKQVLGTDCQPMSLRSSSPYSC
jgi:hypothetical protein